MITVFLTWKLQKRQFRQFFCFCFVLFLFLFFSVGPCEDGGDLARVAFSDAFFFFFFFFLSLRQTQKVRVWNKTLPTAQMTEFINFQRPRRRLSVFHLCGFEAKLGLPTHAIPGLVITWSII